MIRRTVAVMIALVFVSACSAFDHDPEPFEGFSPDEIPLNPFLATGPYEGMYDGTMKLDSVTDACVTVAEAVGDEIDVALDVVQVGELISIVFEGDVEESGKLVDNRVTVVKRDISDMRMYHLDFVDNGITGVCEVFALEGEGAGTVPCAEYSIELSRGE